MYDDTKRLNQSIYGLICYALYFEEGSVSASCTIFGQCDSLYLHVFDLVVAGIHHIPGIITVLVPTGCG